MNTHRRTYAVVAGRRVRLWIVVFLVSEWGKPESPRLFSWGFLRSVWSLLSRVAWRRSSIAMGRDPIGDTNRSDVLLLVHRPSMAE